MAAIAAVPPPPEVKVNLPEPAPLLTTLLEVAEPSATVFPDLSTLNSAVPPTLRRIRNEPPALEVSVTSSSQPSKVVAPLFQVAVEAIGDAALVMVPRVKVFAPKNDWAEVVTRPRLEVDALGILKV